MAIANNEIRYTTNDGQIVTPNGLTPTANTYSDGKGVMTFASDVTSIPNNFLSGTTTLTSVELPHSVLSVGSNSFRGCHNLTAATLQEGVTGIGTYAFASTNLVDFGWPSTVTSIGGDAYGSFWASGATWAGDTLKHTMRINARSMSGYCCWANLRLNEIIFSENVTGGSSGDYYYNGQGWGTGPKATGLTDIWFEHETSLPSGDYFWNALTPKNNNYIPATGTLHLFQGVDESNLKGGITAWTKVYYTKKVATSLTVTNLTWVTDIAGTGGTADSENCSYNAVVEFDDGSVETNPTALVVSGSITASANPYHLRRVVGDLNLTFSINDLSYIGTVTAYQEGLFKTIIPYNNIYREGVNLN